MYPIIQPAHSIFAYIVLSVLFLAVLNAISGVVSKRIFTAKDLRISLFVLILSHFQLLIGFVLYFVSGKGMEAFQIPGAMKDSALRLTMLEHPLLNVIAIALITIGWSKHKREESNNGKFKKIALFYTLGLLLILARIPWSSWLN
jgi:NADH:ubiquinone oxidoreductase subunit 2 (subunit N)